jgi:predicted  nucleic acid-binding Zn-ribbon protein
MKTKLKVERSQVITLVLIAALVASVFMITGLYTKNSDLKKAADKERLAADNLLSESLLLKKDIDKFTGQLKSLKGKNSELDLLVQKSNEKIAGKQAEIDKMMKENKQAKEIKAKMTELETLKHNLQEQIDVMKNKMNKLQNENYELAENNSKLEKDKKQISENMQLAQMVAANNFLIEALKGKKEKLTVSAKKTNKIKADFDVPSNIESQITFKVVHPDGKVVDSKKDKTISLNLIHSSSSTAIASAGMVIPVKAKKMQMVYQPLEKLKPGIYSIDAYSNGIYLGTSKVKLK